MDKKDECMNPDESLAELYVLRQKYTQEIKKLQASGALEHRIKDKVSALGNVNRRIAKIENAGRTGGVIRII